MTKRHRVRFLLLILVVTGAAVVLGVAGADVYFDDPIPEGPVPNAVLPVLPGQDPEVSGPGGLLGAVQTRVAAPPFGAPAAASAPAGLDGHQDPRDGSGPAADDAPILAPGEADDRDSGLGPGADDEPPPTDGEAAGTEAALGTIIRWLDMCAVGGAAGCPLGVAATILPLGDLLPALEVEAFPEATRAVFPDLRCDPGWPSQTVLPIVVASNRPLDSLDVHLQDWDEVIWGLEADLASSQSESARFESRRESGQPIFADMATGVHTCVGLGLHADTPRGDTFVLRVTARSGEDRVDLRVPFAAQFGIGRPPITLHPQDEYNATVRVPQRYEGQTAVWIAAGTEREAACDTVPGEAVIDVAVSKIPDSVLDDDAYPWDRDYDHVTYRYLRLQHSQEYTLCVHRLDEGITQAFIIETPDGWHLDVTSGVLAHMQDLPAGLLEVRFEGIGGCGKAEFASGPLPNVKLEGRGGYYEVEGERICSSLGPFDDPLSYVVPVRGGQDERDAFRVGVPVALFDACRAGASSVGYPCQQMLRWNHIKMIRGNGLDIDWDIVEAMFRIAISGGSDMSALIDLAESLTAPPRNRDPDPWMLQIDLETRRITTNNRPHPLDWGFTEMLRLGELEPTVPVSG